MSTSDHQLSQAAYDRLKAELDELRTVGRIEIALECGRRISCDADIDPARLQALVTALEAC